MVSVLIFISLYWQRDFSEKICNWFHWGYQGKIPGGRVKGRVKVVEIPEGSMSISGKSGNFRGLMVKSTGNLGKSTSKKKKKNIYIYIYIYIYIST